MAKVNFLFQSEIFNLSGRRKLKKHIENIFNAEKKTLKVLNVIFCTERYLLKMNKQFLHKDEYTDVISFDLSQYKSEIIGEIYISVKRVKENARSLNIPYFNELYRVIFHGILHLCGYKDRNNKTKRLIRNKED